MAVLYTPFINECFRLITARAFSLVGVEAANDIEIRFDGRVSRQDVAVRLPHASSLLSTGICLNRVKLLKMGNPVLYTHSCRKLYSANRIKICRILDYVILDFTVKMNRCLLRLLPWKAVVVSDETWSLTLLEEHSVCC
jgi:hypothetical protein